MPVIHPLAGSQHRLDDLRVSSPPDLSGRWGTGRDIISVPGDPCRSRPGQEHLGGVRSTRGLGAWGADRPSSLSSSSVERWLRVRA